MHIFLAVLYHYQYVKEQLISNNTSNCLASHFQCNAFSSCESSLACIAKRFLQLFWFYITQEKRKILGQKKCISPALISPSLMEQPTRVEGEDLFCTASLKYEINIEGNQYSHCRMDCTK